MTATARRVAFVSDIHGNLPAFEAVLERLDQLGPFDAIVGGGDYATGGSNPSECVALARSLDWRHVRGNGDEFLAEIATGGRVAIQDFPAGADPAIWRGERTQWAARQLQQPDVEFLAGLPLSWQCSGPSGQTLKFVHATPWSSHPIVWPDADESEKREMVEGGGVDALLYGHVHLPYIQHIDGKLLACVGSVGASFDGDPRACFAIATDDGDGWRVEHVRVDYDVEAHARAVEESGMPDPESVAAELRTAKLPAGAAAAVSNRHNSETETTTEGQI